MPEPPRRVLLTADAVGGVWNYSIDLCRELARSGIEVLLAVLGGNVSASKRQTAESIPGLQLHIHEGKLEWMDDPWDDVAAAGKWLLALGSKVKPDIVHLNGYAHAALPWDAPVAVVAHSCVLSWFRAVRGEDAPASWDCYRAAVLAGLHQADLVISPTAAMLQDLVTCWGPLPRTRVIPNGCNPHLFHVAPKQPVILAAGRAWDDAKNFGVLASAAPLVDWPILLAGDPLRPGDATPRAWNSLQSLGLLEPAALRDLYATSAIFALPALYEPFGLSALEAALSGCALVLADIPSLRETWNHAALFADPHNPHHWTEQLNTVIRDEARRRSLASAARHHAAQFTAQATAAQYLDVYRNLHQASPSCASASSATLFDLTGTTETPTFSVA